MARVVVLGAGPCGLAAAWRLARAGAEVTVLERADHVGGLAATARRDGFAFDLGGHRLISASPDVLAAARELLGGDLLERERASAILFGGRTFRYPLELPDVLRNLPPVDGALALAAHALEMLRSAVAPRPEARSFEDWVVARFGRPLYRAFFGPYTEKLWGIPPSRLSADWAAQRISLTGLGDVVRRLLAPGRRPAPRTYARRYLYPRKGMGQLFEAMAARVESLGGRIVLGARPFSLEAAGGGGPVAAVRAETAAGPIEVPCTHVISTIPLPALADLLPGGPGGAPLARPLRFRALRCLNVLLDRPALSRYTWLYVGDPRILFTRIQEPRQRSPESAPPGRTSVMLEIPCDEGDALWSAPDDALLGRALGDLRRVGFDLARDVAGCFSSRAAHAYPVYDLGYRERRDRLLARIARAGNVVTAGRQGLFRYIFMDVAMSMGFRAAERILAGRGPDAAELLGIQSGSSLLEAASVA